MTEHTTELITLTKSTYRCSRLGLAFPNAKFVPQCVFRMRHGPYSVQRGQVKVKQKDGKYYSFLGSYSKLRCTLTHT